MLTIIKMQQIMCRLSMPLTLRPWRCTQPGERGAALRAQGHRGSASHKVFSTKSSSSAPGQSAAARVCDIMPSSGCRRTQNAEHSPSQELKETLYNAAYHDGAHGLHASAGMAIVTAGAAQAQLLAPSVHSRRRCCGLASQGYAQQREFTFNTDFLPYYHSAMKQTSMQLSLNTPHLAGFLF